MTATPKLTPMRRLAMVLAAVVLASASCTASSVQDAPPPTPTIERASIGTTDAFCAAFATWEVAPTEANRRALVAAAPPELERLTDVLAPLFAALERSPLDQQAVDAARALPEVAEATAVLNQLVAGGC